VQGTRTLVIHPYLKRADANLRTPEGRLEEAARLALAIDLTVLDRRLVPLSAVRPATLIGQGKAEEIAAFVKEQDIGLVIVDHRVSPAQQRNLEKLWNCKVIDRTALILEIFGARARTHEVKLQVELAALNYQRSRLVRSWTHLERQRGGFGFLGGPGESQIEIDRRLIRDRIAKIRKELEQVKRTRELHRKTRRDVPYPVVALVGYTNAGKSTLFNRLTGASVAAVDLLFATLDPTLRAVKLPSGTQMILSDTVGFISDLPHDLVAAFRATLEEVVGADVILHVRDISHPDTEAQKQDVLAVLRDLMSEEEIEHRCIEVGNKIDALSETERESLLARGGERAVSVSAATGEGIGQLLETLDGFLATRLLVTDELTLPAADGKTLAWLYRHGSVLSQQSEEEQLRLMVRLSPENWERLRKSLS
jgi:GTP-binding protein HflX